jgi:general stress protein YciG
MPNNNPTGHNQYSNHKEQLTHDLQQHDSPHHESQHVEHSQGSETAVSYSASSSVSEPASAAGGSTPAKRGFAAMDEATQRGIASKGGQSQGKDNNPGNFANDRDRAREAGRKGGEAHGTHRDSQPATSPSINH